MGGPSDSEDEKRLTNSRRDFLHLSGIGAMGLSGIGAASGSAFASTGTGHVFEDVDTGVRPATDTKSVSEGFEDGSFSDTFEDSSQSSVEPTTTQAHAHSGSWSLALDSFPGTTTRNSVDSLDVWTGELRCAAYIKPTQIDGPEGSIGIQLLDVDTQANMTVQSSGYYGGIAFIPRDEDGDPERWRAETFGEVLPVGDWTNFEVQVTSTGITATVGGDSHTFETNADWTKKSVRIRLFSSGWGSGHARSAVFDDVEMQGIRNLGDGICPDSARFCDDWSDGDFTSSPPWEVYLDQGDFSADVRTLSSVPAGGPNVLHVTETTGGGTDGVIGWQNAQTGWDTAWTLSGLFYTQELNPSIDYQSHELLAYYDGSGDDAPIAPLLGFTDSGANLEAFRIRGDLIDSVEETHAVHWSEDTWYHYEIGHDGSGTYTGRLWEDGEGRPSEPNARSTGGVPGSDARVAAIDINGAPARGDDDLDINHAYMKWVEGGPDDGPAEEVTLDQLSLLQRHEPSRLVDTDDGSTHELLPDAARVAGLDTIVGFDVEATGGAVDGPVDVEIAIDRGGGDVESTVITVTSAEFDQLATAAGRPATVERLFAIAGDEIPIFDDRLETIEEVRVSVLDADGDSLGEAVLDSSEIPRFASLPDTIDVGFIEVSPPSAARSDGDPYDPVGRFDDTIDLAETRIVKSYPVDSVRSLRADVSIVGNPDTADNAVYRDMVEAHCALEHALDESATFDALDATVLVVPEGYYPYHGSLLRKGQHNWRFGPKTAVSAGNLDELCSRDSQPPAAVVATEIPSDGGETRDAGVTVAHEVGHHLLSPCFYEDQRALQRSDIGRPNDGSHANSPNDADDLVMRTTGYQLADSDVLFDRDSLMIGQSTGVAQRWTDTLMYNEIVGNSDGTGGIQPAIPVERRDTAISTVLVGIATIGPVEITVPSVRVCTGAPMANESEPNVGIQVLDGADNVLDAFGTVATSVAVGQQSADDSAGYETIDAFAFAVSFPEDAASIRIEDLEGGTTTRINPVSSSLASAIERTPDSVFAKNPDNRRNALLNKVNALESQIDDGAFRGATNKLRRDVRDKVQKWLVADVSVAANRTSKAELLELVDEMASRLERLASENGNGGPSNGRGPSDDGPSDRGNGKGR